MRLRAATVTASQARQNRAWLDREIARAYRAEQRRKLKELRAGIREVKRRRALWRKAASRRYAKLRAIARAQHAAIRARVRERLRQKFERERLAIREAHVQRRARIAAEFSDLEERAQKMLAAERKEQRELARAERRGLERKKTRRTAREALEESDDEVRKNLTPEEVVIFEKVKRQIKATPRKTRTEAFAEWLESNPDEARIIHAEAVEWKPGELEAAERAYLERQRELEPPRVKKAAARHAETFLGNGKESETLEEYLAGVPF
jgi:hypothetical protein